MSAFVICLGWEFTDEKIRRGKVENGNGKLKVIKSSFFPQLSSLMDEKTAKRFRKQTERRSPSESFLCFINYSGLLLYSLWTTARPLKTDAALALNDLEMLLLPTFFVCRPSSIIFTHLLLYFLLTTIIPVHEVILLSILGSFACFLL